MNEGELLAILRNTHDLSKCVGHACFVHNRTEHHMRDWPVQWRDDRKIVERICVHGIGHPDPDQADFLNDAGMTHGCDGCC